MKYTIVICSGQTLKIGVPEFFEGIAEVDLEAGFIEINVTDRGRAELNWILDANGTFFALTSLGILPRTIFQRIGLSRAREKFQIIPGRRISVDELAGRVAGLLNQFEEAPNVTDMQAFLAGMPPDHLLESADMSRYLGE